MYDANYKPPDEQTPPLAGVHWQRNYENMGIMPSQKNVTRTRLNVNFETLKRKIEILDVLNEIYGEGIPNTSNAEQIRPVTRGCEADTRATRIPVPHLRENPVNGEVGDRSPARQELEEDAS